MPDRLVNLGLTPAKLVLVGVLSVVLAAVWGPQLLGGSSRGRSKGATAGVAANAAPVPIAAGPGSPAADGSATRPAAAAEGAAERRRTTFRLADALRTDPFRVPAWSPDHVATEPDPAADGAAGDAVAVAESRAATLERLRQTGVAMVLISGGKQAAQIGDQTVRVGDQIDGFRIVEISDEGVTIAPAEGGSDGA